MQFAWGVVSVDLVQPNPFFSTKDDRKISGAAELQELLPTLRQQAAQKIGATDDFEQWQGEHLLEAVKAAERITQAPFCAHIDTPYYNWRCWDLRQGQPKELDQNDVILVVDIHT